MKKYLILALILIPAAGWCATYSFRVNGTAADKAAAAGSNCAACATDPSTCMGPTVYAGETFSDGDVIVRCHSILGGIPLPIWSTSFADVSQTLSIPAAPTAKYLTITSEFVTIEGNKIDIQ